MQAAKPAISGAQIRAARAFLRTLAGAEGRAALTKAGLEPLGPVPFKGKTAAVEVFSVDPGQKH